MEEQKLEKKVENLAQKFRQRALKGHGDEKRRDRVRPDEKELMWIAHSQLGWSFTKIGSVFKRDPRSVIKALRNFEQKEQVERQTNQQDPLIIEAMRMHFSDLNDYIGFICIWLVLLINEKYLSIVTRASISKLSCKLLR